MTWMKARECFLHYEGPNFSNLMSLTNLCVIALLFYNRGSFVVEEIMTITRDQNMFFFLKNLLLNTDVTYFSPFINNEIIFFKFLLEECKYFGFVEIRFWIMVM